MICRDVTGQVRSEGIGTARREALSKLAAGDPLADVLKVLAQASEEFLSDPNHVCIMLREGAGENLLPPLACAGESGAEERLRVVAAPSLSTSLRSALDGVPANVSGGACGAAAQRNERVVIPDLAVAPLNPDLAEVKAAHGLRAVWSTPINAADGTRLGSFAVYHEIVRSPTAGDFAVIDPLVQTAAVVIERAAADARAARLTQDLKRNEFRFRGTFENVGVGVAHVGLDGAWLRVNRRLCEIVGYPEEELRALTFQDITHPEDLTNDLELFGQLLGGLIPSYSMRKRYFRKSGEIIWIHLTVALQRTLTGEGEYAISVVEDISEKVRAEEELVELNATLELQVASRTQQIRRQKEKLERLAKGLAEAENRERRRLAHVVHDDLQQVLAAAKMSASGLLAGERAAGDPGPPGPAAATVALLDEAMNRARSLTQELVPTVLYDRGLVPALATLCRRSADRFQHAVTFTGLHGDGPPPSDLFGRSATNGPLVFQAARELLFNASKHAPQRPVRVALGKIENGLLRLVVSNPLSCDSDSADAATSVQAADPSTPLSDDGDEGFGLFSLREQAALVGGRLTLSRTTGTFTATLSVPLRPQLHASEPMTVSAPATAPSSVVVRVMIVDDHRIVRSALVGLLASTDGIEVVGEAADGIEAINLVAELKPDTVVMDVTMPRMDGIEATRRVRELNPQVRVVGLSMHDRDDMAEAMCQAGAEAYVPKGGPPEELIRVLRGERSLNNC